MQDISTNKKNTLHKFFLSATILFIFIIILNIFSGQIRNAFYNINYPVEKIFWRAGESTSVFFTTVLGTKNLKEEIKNLKEENQKLLSEISSLQCNQAKSQTEAEFFSISQQLGLTTVLSGVIGLDSQQDIVSIDKGSANGILEGMALINQQGVLFGKVIKVYQNFSKVMLLSNKSSILDVKIQQDDLAKPIINGVVKGKGGLAIYLDLVPTDAEIKSGEVLVTSSLEGLFPKGLLVGKIIQDYKDDQKPFQQASVEPFFNIKNAENLFIITGYKKGE
jgi:rod shape-determining protein MreC